MATPGVRKILVIGDVVGRFQPLVAKLSSLFSSHGAFDAVFCVGRFFASPHDDMSDLLSAPLPMPVYFTVADQDCGLGDTLVSLAPNLTYLGGSGVISVSGLSVAYLSGISRPTASMHYTESDIKTLTDNLDVPVDILLTSEWGLGLTPTLLLATAMQDQGSAEVARILKHLGPRYHFTGGAYSVDGRYFELPPYSTPGFKHVTRFLSLAELGNSAKQKALYAVKLTPKSMMEESVLNEKPVETISFPYPSPMAPLPSPGPQSGFKRPRDPSDPQPPVKRVPDSYTCHSCGLKGHFREDCPTPKVVSKVSCWFCLANDDVETHLIADVASHCYVSLAKGGLTTYNSLIVPIKHYETFEAIPAEAWQEIDAQKTKLLTAFKAKGLDSVVTIQFLPPGSGRGGRPAPKYHVHVQVVPLPSEVASDFITRAATLSSSRGVELVTRAPVKNHISELGSKPFVYLEFGDQALFWTGSTRDVDGNFTRHLLAELMGQRERAYWRDCRTSKEHESSVTTDLRNMLLLN